MVRLRTSFCRQLAVFFALGGIATALQPDHSLTQYGHVSWSRKDGRLPGGAYAVAQTVDGRIWVGTESGLLSFDGAKISPWEPPAGAQLPDPPISALASAPDGGLWIGTRQGLLYWKGARLNEYLTSHGTSGPGVSSVIVDHSGTVWVGTAGFNSGGLCNVHANQMKCYGPPDGYQGGAAQTLHEDKAGDIWIGGVNGLYRWNAGVFRRYGPGRSVQAIGRSPEGNIITPCPGGFMQVTGERFTPCSLVNAIHATQTEALLLDRNKGLWIGTAEDGLFHFYQGHVDQFTRADGLSGDTVLSLFEDREGNVWVGTDKGLDRFWDLPVTVLSKREGLSTDVVVSAFASKKGGVWLGTTQGLNRAWPGGADANGVGVPMGRVGAVFEDNSQTLWVDSNRGLRFVDKGGMRWLRLAGERQVGPIAAAAQNRDGSIWFSDWNHGLIRVENRRVVKVIPWSRLGNKLGSALDPDPVTGKLLIGFAQGGVGDFDGERVIHQYTAVDGLGSGVVTDIYFEASGVAWIATESGLSRLWNGKIATLASRNGLPCSRIHSMVEDDDRNLWLNTPCGLLRISRSELKAWSADPRVVVKPVIFGARDGMHLRPKTYGYFRGAVKSADGHLWFPELDGIAVVDPHHLPHNSLPPPVEIEAVVSDQTTHAVHAGMNLPHVYQELQIDYTAFSFVDPRQVHFKYKLQGYDKGWVDAGNRREAIYPSLPPRKYVFQVIACNNDGVWNNTGASLNFSIAPTFYQTVWFRLLSAITLIGIGWAAYKLRVRHLEAKLNLRFEERMKERMRISRDLHDTLLQNISGFALQIDALSKIVVSAPHSAREQLRELRRQAETWLREARESVWELRVPASDEDDLAMAIQRTGNKILVDKNIAFEIRTSGRHQALASQTKQGLIRIVQEAIRNAAVHSHAPKIDVHLSWLAGNEVSLEICDNGRGFDFDEASRRPGHWGLASMQEHAEGIAAELRIDASPGQGVRIVVRSPLTPPDRINNEREAHSHTHR